MARCYWQRLEMEDEDRLKADLFPVLDRLVKCGFATGWRYVPGDIQVDWDPDFEGGLGGQAGFHGLVALFSRLYEAGPLSETDQAMLLILDGAWHEENGQWEG